MSLHLLGSIFSELKHCSAYSSRDGVTVVTPGNMHIEIVTRYFDEPLVLAALESITAALRERVDAADLTEVASASNETEAPVFAVAAQGSINAL